MLNVPIVSLSMEEFVEEFNEIPDVEVALAEARLLGGQAFVEQTLGDLFVKYDMQETFNVGLLHKSFKLEREDEKIVEKDGVLNFWKSKEHTDAENEQLHPICWRVLKGRGLMPYEFVQEMSPDKKAMDLSDPVYQQFLREFVDVIEEAGFQNIFALWKRLPAWEDGTAHYPPGATLVLSGDPIRIQWTFATT